MNINALVKFPDYDIASFKARIKKIEIKTKRACRAYVAGIHKSFSRGVGFNFQQLREYERGDDIRFIDWKAYGRTLVPMVKIYQEEQSRTVLIAIDVSRSLFFGAGTTLKYERAVEVAAIVACIAQQYKDPVGLILFSQEVEVYLPPHAGMHHVDKIVEALCNHVVRYAQTSFTCLADYVVRLKRKDMVLFVVSDFIQTDENLMALGRVVQRCEVMAITLVDKNELQIPYVGFLPLLDPETNASCVLDIRRAGGRVIHQMLDARIQHQQKFLQRKGMRTMILSCQQEPIDSLIKYFKHIVHKPH